jgi:hypothetical protein
VLFRPVATPILGLLMLAAGVPVPTINPEPSCRSAAARAQPIGDAEICMRLERRARDEMVTRWGEFSDGDKAACISLATAGGNPTYTELLTCLDLKRHARLLREREGRDAIAWGRAR